MQIDNNLRVLVVDDNQAMRKTVRSMLKEMGLTNTSEACDGIQALSQLKESRYDLLVSDWNMPNLDGLSLIRIIRSDNELKDLIAIMVTAEAEREHVLDAIKVGINDYIVKPFTAEVLQKKIENLFNKRTPVKESN